MSTEPKEPIEPEVIEEDELDLRRPDVPVTVEEIAALGEKEAQSIIDSRVQIIRTLRAASIRQCHPSDWVLNRDTKTGRVLGFLEDKGCQRLMDLWGISVSNVSKPEPTHSADGAEYAFSVTGDGYCNVTRRAMANVEGTRYSTERFALEQPDGIRREVAVKKAAYANLEGRIVRNLAGLNGIPLDELITVTGIKEFEAKASKGKGYGSQAERQGAPVQQSEIEPEFQPRCETCNTVMKFIPAGKTQQGKPYDAFWSCPSREHKYTLKHSQALTEAEALKKERRSNDSQE